MKKCRKCQKEKSPNEFDINRRICKECRRAQNRNYYYNNIEAYRLRSKKRKRSPEQRRQYDLKAQFGLTPEQYGLLSESQDGKCAICKRRSLKKHLGVDHDHKTKIVRGLLCGRCNHKLLGAAHDSEVILQNAIEYLKSPPAISIIGEHKTPK